jgi:hypothetical protein
MASSAANSFATGSVSLSDMAERLLAKWGSRGESAGKLALFYTFNQHDCSQSFSGTGLPYPTLLPYQNTLIEIYVKQESLLLTDRHLEENLNEIENYHLLSNISCSRHRWLITPINKYCLRILVHARRLR